MTTKTAYNHLTRLKRKLRSAYSAAYFYMPTHKKLLEDTAPILNDPVLLKCPQWVRQSLCDLSGFLFDDIQRNRVYWAFETERGIMAYSLLSRDERDAINRQANPGAHYWIKEITPTVGTVANPGNHKAGETFARSFVVTTNKW